MMDVIWNNMMIIYIDRSGKGKKIQPKNREWVITIEYISNDGFILSLFLVVQNVNHFVFWYIEYNLSFSWVITIFLND